MRHRCQAKPGKPTEKIATFLQKPRVRVHERQQFLYFGTTLKQQAGTLSNFEQELNQFGIQTRAASKFCLFLVKT